MSTRVDLFLKGKDSSDPNVHEDCMRILEEMIDRHDKQIELIIGLIKNNDERIDSLSRMIKNMENQINNLQIVRTKYDDVY